VTPDGQTDGIAAIMVSPTIGGVTVSLITAGVVSAGATGKQLINDNECV